MSTEFDRLEGKIDRLTDSVANVQAEVALLRGKVDTELKNHHGQIGVLFDRAHETAQRVALIERDYVPQPRCFLTGEQNRKEHEEFRTAIGVLRDNVTRILAVVGIVYTAITVGVQLAISRLSK